MYVETERSRNGYRAYSDRKYDQRLKRKSSRHDEHPYHSSRISRHHYSPPSKRLEYNPSNSYTNHSFPSRYDRDIYNEQAILSSDVYYTRERESDSERNRYPPIDQFKVPFRRECSPPPSYRTEYRSPTPSSVRSSIDPYHESYRSNDYQTRSERYDIPQTRTCSITTLPSSAYQTSSSYSSMREVDYRTREYAQPPLVSNHYPSYRERSNFKRSDKRSIRR